jgi:hypothetical protein
MGLGRLIGGFAKRRMATAAGKVGWMGGMGGMGENIEHRTLNIEWVTA